MPHKALTYLTRAATTMCRAAQNGQRTGRVRHTRAAAVTPRLQGRILGTGSGSQLLTASSLVLCRHRVWKPVSVLHGLTEEIMYLMVTTLL